ncbi:uncharacterized protein LOC110267436 [Arachis ipaensis]|uniref:uncharacterized protein LOC110267436 n=1 Tax=Arachis ipaensis TaxID=130454 RepID=UPI000A2B252B|nr:uncharacterized protein LOC110267436 [Arachis ipaensis]XP_025681767.1 uncharacterized protein LOC112783172 [Arachis hypogaea]
MHSLQKQRSLLFQYLRSSPNSNNIIHNSKMILSSSSLLLASNFSSTAGKVIPCKVRTTNISTHIRTRSIWFTRVVSIDFGPFSIPTPCIPHYVKYLILAQRKD